LEKDHGLLERRRVCIICDIAFLSGKKQWKEIKTIVEYQCKRKVGGETTVTDRYCISSKDAGVDEFCKIIRNYWSIKNADFSPTALGA